MGIRRFLLVHGRAKPCSLVSAQPSCLVKSRLKGAVAEPQMCTLLNVGAICFQQTQTPKTSTARGTRGVQVWRGRHITHTHVRMMPFISGESIVTDKLQ